jgi:hypothetical protein
MPDGRDADAIHITRIAFLLVIHAVWKLKRGHDVVIRQFLAHTEITHSLHYWFAMLTRQRL